MQDIPLNHLRAEYLSGSLTEKDIQADPIIQIRQWLSEAMTAGVLEPNAMALATVSADGMPAARMVLLKELTEQGFVFFGRYDSRKGNHLASNPLAALLFFWDKMERQIRIEGSVEKLEPSESDAYFHSRPLMSRISAVISPQSQVIPDRSWLESRWQERARECTNKEPERPDQWGGYLLRPVLLEFWQGRESRLHDRIQYRKTAGSWIIERLAP
ncbi:MAG TPA: pyridoxamine 5'-phosphate oxidase [Bacteroidales bacterium]|nr:pyridoxamine 5'-phosphate oxidase [Bacteroidales bacterium]